MRLTVSIDQPINFTIDTDEETIESISLPTWCWQFDSESITDIWTEQGVVVLTGLVGEKVTSILENADWPDEVTYE